MATDRHAPSSTSGIPGSTVFVVDDEESMRLALRDLLESVGYCVETFGSVREFLDFRKPGSPSCLILDVRLKGESGLAFQQAMAREGLHMPVLFMTGHGDMEMSVRAMKAGAFHFFPKPFRDQDMLDAISEAISKDAQRLEKELSLNVLRAAYKSLTPRECDILALVVSGMLNKHIAVQLNVSEITVKIHRGQVMRKMGAHSLADLVFKAAALDIGPRQGRPRP
ncbi:LuxR family two component transcriptional regulator [Paraburkholderia sp. BL6669N2]|uniref:response regulator transcription factor n=1 Tax=Paraburkholderia sp. BL6669N2 TaxID=1938807 RepID=UPI000E222751|nr:response regulator [Paraburkholderia sp. BL6669N2]REG48826.1 LuxR family two component transcriptional regulator [Paraburkholderia sp. BL6669N2]